MAIADIFTNERFFEVVSLVRSALNRIAPR